MMNLNFINGYCLMKQKQVKHFAVVLLLLTSVAFVEADDALPDDAFIEFLGEFSGDDDDILAIAFETPLDVSESKPLETTEHEVIESMGAGHSE